MGEANSCVHFLYVPQTICNHIQGQVSGSMNADTVNKIYSSQQSTKEGLRKEFEGYFISRNQSTDVNKKLHSTVTLAMNFHKPEGGNNMYVRFGYVSQKQFNHSWGQVLVSINTDTINNNKQVHNQQC